jgi:hypothetical protein
MENYVEDHKLPYGNSDGIQRFKNAFGLDFRARVSQSKVYQSICTIFQKISQISEKLTKLKLEDPEAEQRKAFPLFDEDE